MKKKITMMDVKQALLDSRFREKLPAEFLTDVQKFLSNPGCACNHPIYKKLMKGASKELAEYYPNKETVSDDEAEKLDKLSKNEWKVINCTIHDLQDQLRKLGPGRKQLEIARFQDQVTVVVNELDFVF